MDPISDKDDDYLQRLVDYKDEDLIDEDLVEDEYDYGKNYDMLQQLILDAGSNYIEEKGPTKLEYYLDNLVRVDSLKSFVDDQNDGLLGAADFLLLPSIKTEAILRYIVGHKNVEFHQENVVMAAGRSEYIFSKLIEAGGNVHHKTSKTYFTTLHVAVLDIRTNIIKYLLDQNVDVNCYNQHECTALHYAFGTYNNLDIIELLIQHGADMYLRDGRHLTPFEYAISMRNFNIVSLVLNSKLAGNISFDLMKQGFSRFCQLYSENSEEYQNNFFNSLRQQKRIINYFDFFKLLCDNLIKYFIVNNNIREPPLFSIYLNNNIFESKDWANALKLLLTSEIASVLLEECLSYEKKSIYALLIPKLIRAEVELEDRIELLKLLVSLKMVPNLEDMALVLTHYRFNEEFQLLNLSLRDDCLLNGYNQENPMEYIASVFCGLENDLDYNRIFGEELPEKFYDYIKQYFTPALSNCSSNANYHNGEMKLPGILSLQELSRNSARKLIKRSKILSPRDFISAVHSLPIPLKCKNYILLKTKVDEL